MDNSIVTTDTPSLNESQTAFISQHLFTAVLWVDEALVVQWINPQTEQLLAISRARLLNHSILTLLASNEIQDKSDDFGITNTATKTCSLKERFAQSQHYQQPFIDHDHIISSSLSNGAVLSVDYSVTPVIYEQKPFFIVEMWGKNRQSRITKDQRKQQQYEVARQMLRSVAHEVKNPLAGIRGAAQLLQRQFNKLYDDSANDSSSHRHSTANDLTITESATRTVAQKLRSYTDIIISETDRLTALIGQLLGSNQLPDWRTLNIHESLEHVLTLVLSQYPKIHVERDYDLSLPELCADKDQLIQVFLNLINNACEAMSEKQYDVQTQSARLHLQTRVAFQHTIGHQQHRQVLQVAITDNGSGIDPSLIEQIFFPMVTSRATGTGLGLSIVQDIVHRHHGMIEVTSDQNLAQHSEPYLNLGQTRFTVYLPFEQPSDIVNSIQK